MILLVLLLLPKFLNSFCKLLSINFKSNFFDKPKSDNLMWPSASIKTLSGFKSLWIQSNLWTDSIAKTISAA